MGQLQLRALHVIILESDFKAMAIELACVFCILFSGVMSYPSGMEIICPNIGSAFSLSLFTFFSLHDWHLRDMKCTVHDLEVMGSNPYLLELGMRSTSVYIVVYLSFEEQCFELISVNHNRYMYS